MTLEDRLIVTSGKGPGFDQIRLAAASIVLLHHCRLTQHDVNDPLFLYSGGFVHFGLLAVMIFFAISGFLVVPGLVRSRNLSKFFVNRALRIFPALIVVVISTMFFLGPFLSSLPAPEYFSDPRLYLYLKNVLTSTYNFLPGVAANDGGPAVVNGALWTLHFEVLAYAALALMCSVGALHNRAFCFLILLASYLTYALMMFAPTIAQHGPGRFITFMSLFTYFATGAALFVFRDRVPFSARLALAALAILLVGLPMGLGPLLLPVCLPYLSIYFGMCVLPGQSFVKRDLSYGVYLIHAPLIVAFVKLLPSVKVWWLLALMVAVAAVGLSYLCRILVEEPALRQKTALSHWIECKVAVIKLSRISDS